MQIAVEVGAASADHCTHLDDADVEALAGSSTVATLLPGAEFSTRSPYPDARRLLDAGVTVALAADCNPGSRYTTIDPVLHRGGRARHAHDAVRGACGRPRPAARVRCAATTWACSRVGARGDLVVLDAPSHLHLAYRPGVPLVRTVVRGGAVVHDRP